MSNVDIKGLRFGRLVAVSLDFSKSRKAYLCKCDCGNKKVIMRQSLINGCTSSCGCIKKKYNHPKGYNTKTYKLWHTMIRRCHNKKSKDYKRYSSKGIIVCDRWQGLNGFVNFISDMGERTSDLHSIDRIDNDGIYTPENCRWATIDEQANNRSSNLPITINGETKNLCQWSVIYKINNQTISERIKRGWDHALAVTKPVNKACRSGKARNNGMF
tara:strand:+ start:164 stop:808 length:645 start_codon:yes stop_codon:yes gene_type:complete